MAWNDASRSLIGAARTNTTATRFGVVRTVRPPSRAAVVESLQVQVQVQGSSGRLDVVVHILASTGDSAFWHTQILPSLKLRISPARISHTAARRVVFSVTGAGQRVRRATVTWLGRHARTGVHGTVAMRIPSGMSVGRHVCRARRTGYHPATATIRVT